MHTVCRYFVWAFLAFLVGLIFSGISVATESFVLNGRILDISGRPMAGAEVYAYVTANVKRPADLISHKTDMDGVYRLELPEGTYWVMAILRKNGAGFGPLGKDDRHSGDPYSVNPDGRTEVSHDFTIMDLREAALSNQKKNSDLVKITGRLLDSKLQPVAMAYAMADQRKKPGDFPSYFSTWTNQDGRYVLYLPHGRFYLGAITDFPPSNGYLLEIEKILEEDISDFDLTVVGQ